jgi:hypothetical protein
MDILQRALAQWVARPTPAVLAYDVHFRGTRKGGEFTREIHVQYEAATRTYTAQVTQASGNEPLGVKAERQRLFPDETFGLVPRVRSGTSDDASAASIQTLAVGSESLGGRSVYHLRFAPRSDAERYPVRDVWIDATSFDVRKVAAREVEHAGLLQVPFLLTVDYGSAGPYWLVERGEAGATAHLVLFTLSAQGVATYANYQFPQPASK